MTKYLFIILLAILISPAAHSESETNGFEAELRLLEGQEKLQEEKSEILVEKMSAQNNSNRENDLVEDSVTLNKSATSRENLPEATPVSQEAKIGNKTRRIPSR